ncbi:MAG: hypothetical protein ABR540_11100 [Acidimicrobiales bacterium]
MIALNAFLDEALDRPRAPRWRRVLVGCALAVAIADGAVVVGLVLVDLVRMAMGVGDWAAGLVAAVGAMP